MSRRRRTGFWLVALALVSAVAVSCGGDLGEEPSLPAVVSEVEPQEQTDRQDSIRTPQVELEDEPESQDDSVVELAAEPIFGGYQFQWPMEMLELSDGSFLIADRYGAVTRFFEEGGEWEQRGALDLTERLTTRSEHGLLSMALDPEFDEGAPFLYVYWSPLDAETEVTRLSRFRVDVENGWAAAPESELVILEVPQPYPNHNGGAVRFGPDGMLYLGLGDGGSGGDPLGHGQNRETLLGTIVRLNVRGADARTPYRLPTDNPFLGIAGVRPEVWAYGLRNPWRMAFDSETGELWVGDVGQNELEEVAIVRAGENHGWNAFEGDACFRSQAECDALPDAVPPAAVYGRDLGCSVTGGEVYRGSAMPALAGAYIFGDYCSGRIWSLSADGVLAEHLRLDDSILSFARDREGEIYALTRDAPIRRLVAADDSQAR